MKKKLLFMKYFIYGIMLCLVPLSSIIVFPEDIFRTNDMLYPLLNDILRYPFLEKWFNMIFLTSDFYGDIKLFRALPFLTAVLLSFYLYQAFYKKLNNIFLSFLFSLSFLTIPLILFYSNILYLEMPMVLLMTICIFNNRTLVTKDFENLKLHPVWYCLLLLGLLKETTLIFYILIIMLRISYRIYKRYRAGAIFLSEGKMSLLLISPVLFFLLLRGGPVYEVYLKNMTVLENYSVFGMALVEQTSILCIIAFLGILYLALKKKMLNLTTLAVLFIGIVTFLFAYQRQVDIRSGTANIFIGYSRLNLLFVPLIFYSAFLLITEIKREAQVTLCFLILFINLLLLPLNEGVRKPNWGSPLTDTAEYTYPYDKSIKWLSENHRNETNLIIAGQYYPYYGLRFYLEKYSFHPDIAEYHFSTVRFDKTSEENMLNSFFEKLNKDTYDTSLFNADMILYHSVNNIDLKTNIRYGDKYQLIKRITNPQSSIYIFNRI